MDGKMLFTMALGMAQCLSCFADGLNLKWELSRYAVISNNVLTVSVPKGKAREGGSARATIDLAPFQGKTLLGEILCSGKDISEPPEQWNGLKFMLHYVDTETGEGFWPNTASRLGSFAQRKISLYANLAGVSASQGTLTLGLQSSSGTVVFDLSSLKLEKSDGIYPITNLDYQVAYPERIRKIPVSRGVMLPGGPCTEDDFKTLHEWGATLARYQMTRNWGRAGTDQDLDDYDRWLNGKLDHLEQVLVWAKQYGLKIVVDLHAPPGGRNEDKEMSMFFEKRFADHFVAVWQKMANRFKGRPEIFGYDLINEPLQNLRAPFDYWNLQRMAAEAIRAIDPDTPIILESNEWDSAPAYRYLSALAMPNVIYQVHMYIPGEYTHQGVFAKKIGVAPRVPYPDETRKGGAWNKEYLRKQLEPVRAFQKKHHARIYVGEFSAINWAPGSDRYIADCISIFNEYGWDWTFHAFREWPGWSVEHTGETADTLVPSSDNPRKRALLKGLKE